MPLPVDRGENVDCGAIVAQAAALAEHLQRSGVSWLPKPRPDQVALLQQQLSAAPAKSDAAETATEAAPPNVSAAQPLPDPSLPDPSLTSRPASLSQETTGPRETTGAPETTGVPFRLQPVDAVTSSTGDYPGPSLPVAARQAELDRLAETVAACTRCEVLSSCRNKTVFGEGSVTPRVAFFGEGPGADEDRTGRPFVGRAGQLLTRMIEACKFERSEVYILNTVKCRPPGNRNPELDEISNCREYYQQQLALLRPEYIVCLGAVSAQELLQSKLSVGRLRGKLHRYFESKVLVTYHPAYLLRNPSAKKAAWEDLQIMLRDAGISY